MGVIDDFLDDYERQFDFWDASARMALGLLESALASSGLRAIVTSRAKSVDRLAAKLHARNREKPSLISLEFELRCTSRVRWTRRNGLSERRSMCSRTSASLPKGLRSVPERARLTRLSFQASNQHRGVTRLKRNDSLVMALGISVPSFPTHV